jgi:trans-aconitate methyltransferase
MSQVQSIETDVEKTAQAYSTSIIKGWEKLYREKRRRLFELLSRFHAGDRALEMGVGDGESTSHIFGAFREMEVVDASETFAATIRARFPGIVVHTAFFEAFEPPRRYGTIFMTHILEHLDDPAAVLRRAHGWLEPGGRVLISVPNARSLHRLVGVKMGMIESPYALNEQDRVLGHRRVYDRQSMEALIAQTPFRIVHFTGLMLKPISNRQIEQQWDERMVDAFFQLGFDFPEICAEIIFVLERTE